MSIITIRFRNLLGNEVLELPVTGTFGRLGGLDVSAWNREVCLHYGDLGPPPSPAFADGAGRWLPTLSYSLAIQRLENGTPRGPEQTISGTISRGQDLTLQRWGETVLPDVEALPAPVRSWAYRMARGVERIPQGILDQARTRGQDVEDTDATGSGRLVTFRDPVVLTMLFGRGPARKTAAESLLLWADQQGLRGCHFYDSREAYAPFRAKAGVYLGHGYRSMGGGFETLFSSELPPFEPMQVDGQGKIHGVRTGWYIPHATHHEIAPLVAAGYLLGSAAALRRAVAEVNAIGTHLLAGEKLSSRGIGRFWWSLAHLQPALALAWPGTEALPLLASRLLGYLIDRNRGGAPAPDNGETSEGTGHLNHALMASFLGQIGITDEATIKAFATSDASWFVTQLWAGLSEYLEAASDCGTMPPGPFLQDAELQRDYAARFLERGTRAHLDAHGHPYDAPVTPGIQGTWNELSATSLPSGLRPAEGNGTASLHNGVIPRFWMSTMAVLAGPRGYQDARWWGPAEQAYTYCQLHGTWNGDYPDWALEAAPALEFLPWLPGA